MLGEVAKEKAAVVGNKAMERVDTTRASICIEVPLGCDPSGEAYQRSMREKFLCGHIPECNDIMEQKDEDFDRTKANVGEWSWT
jgi:hypothetical protein